jgi:hypothetical protein
MCAVLMDSGVMLCTPSFIKTGSGNQKLTGLGDLQPHRHKQHGDLTSSILFYFFAYFPSQKPLCL